MNTYTTKQGERLDQICQAYYGSQSGVLEQVLLANPNLSDLPLVLPEATVIALPTISAQKPNKTTELF